MSSASTGADLGFGLIENDAVKASTYLRELQKQLGEDDPLVADISAIGSTGYTNPYEALIYGQAFSNLQNKFADQDTFKSYFADRFVEDTQGPASPAPRKSYADYSKELAANRVSGIGGLAPGLI